MRKVIFPAKALARAIGEVALIGLCGLYGLPSCLHCTTCGVYRLVDEKMFEEWRFKQFR